jgi:CRP-like cAMP-binding protein
MTLNARFFRLLTENELFSGVSPELLRAVLTESQVRFIRFAREETIVCALDGRPALGCLLLGELLQQRENCAVPLQTPQTGDVFGGEALYSGTQTPAGSLVAAKAGEAALLSKSTVTLLLERDSGFAFRYIRHLSQQIALLGSRVGRYAGGSAEQKLAQYLLRGFGDYKTFELDLSMSRLAVLLHIGRASLYRAFASLEQHGAVRRDGKNVRLVDRDTLLMFVPQT